MLTSQPSLSAPRVGLFDFNGYRDLVDTLAQVLGLEEEEVQERLFREAVLTGTNVSEAARAFGVVPHVYDDVMEAFYTATDAFVFELAVIHQNAYCQEIDRRVSEAVAECSDRPEEVEVLVLGDGIGTDSLRLALDGFRVTYFEFEGPSARLARHRFERAGALDSIVRVHSVAEIPERAFDVVINREVLEHVPSPMNIIRDVWRYLKPGGIAIVTESFARVEPQFPTHLADNVQYAGHTPRLFVELGFRVRRIFPEARPMVFEKAALDDRGRFRTLPRRRASLFQRVIRRVTSASRRS